MQTPIPSRIKLLLFGLPLAGVLFFAGALGRGPSLDPSVDPTAFAGAAVATGAMTAWLAIFAGMVVELPAFAALYIVLADSRHARVAFWGMVLSILGIALVLPLIGFMALAAPVVGQLYLAGRPEVIHIAVAMAAGGPGLVLAMLSGVAYCAGSICLAVALRSILHPALLVAFALQAPLLAIVALFSFVAELIGAVLLLVSGMWLVWSIWEAPSPHIVREPAV